MKNGGIRERELIAELESAYQKIFEMEALLKEHGYEGENGTGHFQTMSDVRESEIRYRRLFESAQDGILILEADSGAITDANPFIREILGYSPEDLVGKRLWEIGAFFDIVASKAAFEELQRKEYIRYENLPLQTKDGQLRQVEFISNVYLVDLKKVIQCNIRSISKRKEVEMALKESEIRYRRLFESAKDGILIIDAETGKIIDANPYLLDILNFTQEEVIGKELWEIGPFKYIIANQNTFQKVQDKEYIRYENLLLQNKEGVTVHMEFISNFYFVNDRKVIQCNIRDITERINAEKSLSESEERYHSLVEYSPDAIMVHSCGKTVYVNPAAIKLLGALDASELLGKSIFDIVDPEYRESVRSRITAGIIENRNLPLMEEKLLRSDGSAIDVEVASLPIEYDGIPSMQDVIRDTTEKKKLQQELLQSQKMECIGILAGGIAHDFNNILAIIIGHASLIETCTLDAQKQSESIAAVHKAAQRGAALVRQILTFAQKADVSFEPCNLAELVQDLFSMIEQTFPETITFKKIFPKDIPTIFADRTQIDQVFLNLCVNARDAMPNGGSIVIKAQKQTGKQLKEQFPTADQDSYVCVSVTDTGEGMDEVTRRRVFEPFFTTKPKGKGTGLGLPVVIGVVQAHHGFINVESELGHGTTFQLYFPIPSSIEKPVRVLQAELFEIGGTETILLVEDEELLLEMMRVLLESKGYKVFVARDGAEAVEVYKKHMQEIALVVSDMGLPMMSGIEEFKNLKEVDPNVKVILISGFFEPDIKSELQQSGVNGFLQKPYMSDEILLVLRDVLDKGGK